MYNIELMLHDSELKKYYKDHRDEIDTLFRKLMVAEEEVEEMVQLCMIVRKLNVSACGSLGLAL